MKVCDSHMHFEKLIKICDYIYSQYERQEKLIHNQKAFIDDLKKENDILVADQGDVDEILQRYQSHVDLLTKDLKEKESQIQESTQ